MRITRSFSERPTNVLRACIASSLSIFFKHRLTQGAADITYETMPVFITALVEMCIGIVIACMPSAAKCARESPLLQRLTSVSGWSSLLHKQGTSKKTEHVSNEGRQRLSSSQEFRHNGIIMTHEIHQLHEYKPKTLV